MEILNYEIEISTHPKQVWESMIHPEKYDKWVKAFSEGSTFIGEWKQGAEIKFVDPSMGGTLARLNIFDPYNKIEAQHIASITKDGTKETTGPMTEKWVGTIETYNFSAVDGSKSKLQITMKTHKDFADMFNKCWPKALEKIKQISEE